MGKERLAAFSDGVIAIIITIMVLEIQVPSGASFTALRSLLPVLLSYVLSFVYVGIYWNNHHHLLYAPDGTGKESTGKEKDADKDKNVAGAEATARATG